LENEIFSCRDPEFTWNLIGQPNTSYSRQFDIVIFSAEPPPNRNTDQRVLNELFVRVMYRQLPNIAQASSCDFTMQFETVAYYVLMK